jgi:hypothetical protein
MAARRSKKPQQLRGLNENHNHDMKAIFRSAAAMASRREGPFQDFYLELLTKGMKPAMARLILARKIAAITLIVWKKGAHFRRGTTENTSSLSISGREAVPSLGIILWWWPVGSS